MSEVDLTAVHGLTFEVAREKVLELLSAKEEFLRYAQRLWLHASADQVYLDLATADERKQAEDRAKKDGVPPSMVQVPSRDAIMRLAKKNARLMELGADQFLLQRTYLSPRKTFMLTQEQLAQLGKDDLDKLLPPNWETLDAVKKSAALRQSARFSAV